MSRWPYYGRHASPFSSSPGRGPPVITDNDYTYMTPDDIVDPPAGFWRDGGARQSQQAYSSNASNSNAPDILFVKHRNERIVLHFPAFTIGEGLLKIGTIRRYAADELRVQDPRRVKLLYKNKTLREDAMSARDVGLKQNSEIVCVITETGEDSEDSGEDAYRGRRADEPGGYDNLSRHQRIPGGGRQQGGYTSHPSTPSRPSFPQPTTTSSASGPRPTTSDSRGSPALPTPYTPPPGPRTPKETIHDLTAIFNTKYRPLCQAFINNPPEDPKQRAQEHTKLSETVLAQILLKLDDVATDGNDELRKLRKTAVQDTQAVLTQLDKIVGKAREF